MFNSITGSSRRRLPAMLLSVTCRLLGAQSVLAQTDEYPNGQVKTDPDGTTVVWQAEAGEWVSPEAFWTAYADSSDGRYWGRSEDYPAYASVNEHDTLMIVLPEGPCLMYFFHERWRRAQDVRRWDPEFNELLGCPYVFR